MTHKNPACRRLIALFTGVFLLCGLILLPQQAEARASRAPYQRDFDTERMVFELLKQADSLMDANNFMQAKEVLVKASSYDPNSNSGHTHSRLSHVYQHFGNLEKSVVEAVIALKFDPQIHNLALEVAMNYKEMGKPDQAIAWANKFIEMRPDKLWRQKAEDLIADIEKQRQLEGKYDPHLPDYLGQFVDESEIHPWSPAHLPIRVFIASGKGVPAYQPLFRQHAIDCLNAWMIASNGKLPYLLVDSPEDAYLTIDWTGDALKAGERTKFMETAGITHFPAVTQEEHWRIMQSSINIKTINSASHKAFDEDEVKATLLHEIGHSLGLTGHSTNVNDIMYYSDTSRRLSSLTKRDKATIQRLYADYPQLVNVTAQAAPEASSTTEVSATMQTYTPAASVPSYSTANQGGYQQPSPSYVAPAQPSYAQGYQPPQQNYQPAYPQAGYYPPPQQQGYYPQQPAYGQQYAAPYAAAIPAQAQYGNVPQGYPVQQSYPYTAPQPYVPSNWQVQP